MDDLIKHLLRVLRPGLLWTFLLFVISGAAVILVLASGQHYTVFGYIAYILSAYALASLIVSFPKIKADTRQFINNNKLINSAKSTVYNNKYGNLIVTDVSLRIKISLYASLSVNMIYAVFRLINGIRYSSYWFGAEAVFYIILSIVRFMLLRNVRKNKGDLRNEYQTYRLCGYLLFVMNAALTGVVYQMIYHGRGAQYPGLFIYAAAIYAFFCLIVAIIQMIKFRKYRSPLLSAVKTINLAKALVAMFALQTAMFASFNDGDIVLERIMNSVFGGLVCCAIFAMAVMMVVKSFHELKKTDI